MRHFQSFTRLFLPVLLLCALLAGTAQSALLDVGPTVTQVNPSTEGTFGLGNPPLGHGFPLWYRDSNRIPLQLCTDRASGMCLTAEPNPLAPLSFPTNIGDELFWWVGDASFDIPVQGALTRVGRAILVQAIEAAYSTGSPVPGAQVSFARIRIRVDTPYAGDYVVTTPFKQYNFTVDAATIADGINFTEDIGIAEGAVFTGALGGSVGPFLYCTNAPIVNAFGSFVGDPNVPCSVLGSTFPSAQNPSNFFRVQGPNGFDMQTNQFSVMGKLYTDPIPTPLTADKLTYARDASGVQLSAFATTQAMSNQVNGAQAFPLNFALTNAPSELRLSIQGIPTQIMATNNPADGKFFDATGPVAFQGNLPANASITNVADTPDTVLAAPLVDEIKINAATYNPTTRILTIAAQSLDTITNPTLSAFMPGMTGALGTLTNGQLSVSFPVIDNSGQAPKTFNIPTETIIITSAIGGSATAPVNTFLAVQPAAATGVTVAPTIPSPQLPGNSIAFIASGSGGTGDYEYRFWLKTGAVWSIVQDYSSLSSWSWDTTGAAAGSYFVQVDVRSAGATPSTAQASKVLGYNLSTPAVPASAVLLASTLPSPQTAGASVPFVAAGNGGSGNYQYRFWLNTNGVWAVVQNYSTSASWTWNTAGAAAGPYFVQVDVRNVGSTANREAASVKSFTIQ